MLKNDGLSKCFHFFRIFARAMIHCNAVYLASTSSLTYLDRHWPVWPMKGWRSCLGLIYCTVCNVHVRLIWIVDTMSSRMRQIHAVIVDIFQPCWAHNMYGPQTPWIWIVRFSSNTFFTFFLWFVEFGKQRAIIKSHILSTSHVHTPTENFMIESEKLFDILSTSNTDGIGWGQIWDGNTSKAMASGKTLFPFVHSFSFHCSILQTMMSIFILYDYFSFYLLLDFFFSPVYLLAAAPFIFFTSYFQSLLCMSEKKTKRIK